MSSTLKSAYLNLWDEKKIHHPFQCYHFLYCLVEETAKFQEITNEAPLHEQHLSPQRICTLFSEEVKREFGLFSSLVMEQWGVKSGADIGQVIFNLADQKVFILGTEKMEDFISAGVSF